MKKILTLCLLAISIPTIFAAPKEFIPDFYLESSTEVPGLAKKSEFVIRFEELPSTSDVTHILWSIDKKSTARIALEKDNSLVIQTKPGEHSFQFFYSTDYEEIQTGKVSIKAGHRDVYIARFSETGILYEVEKPVIYLYPETRTEVELKVVPTGKMRFTYPELKDTWKMTAHPNGELEIGDRSYPYLFWEAESPALRANWSEGTLLTRDEVVHFLESQLDFAGLNSKEQSDFITYWAPRMTQHEHCVVHFLQNDECSQFADLIVLPQPDAINRLYIVWAPIENLEDYTYIRPQKLQKINRLGFDILEWGGVEMKTYPVNIEDL